MDQSSEPAHDAAGAEAARYRRQLRDAELERDGLAARVDGFRRSAAERAAARVLRAPADLWLFHDPADVLNEHGDVDEDLVEDLARRLTDSRPGLRRPVPRHGAGGHRAEQVTGWDGVLKGSGT
ncbi:hypothetical protein [Candidatus Blastococcus massiliensis]|uniref:hypothetical protein n=1 Tax=Candidatus Blastococcus massiliensis TaxID=1470358 RepID=UPI0004ADC237|nr:hypothetical protein [Candidatus Blastococcus massiliensis]